MLIKRVENIDKRLPHLYSMRCLICNLETNDRKGKVVCSTTCRVKKKNIFDELTAERRSLRRNMKYSLDDCILLMRRAYRASNRPIRVFYAWEAHYRAEIAKRVQESRKNALSTNRRTTRSEAKTALERSRELLRQYEARQ
jgi:hypothetical protein